MFRSNRLVMLKALKFVYHGFGLVGHVDAITVLGRSASLRWLRMCVRALPRMAGRGRLWPG